LASRKWVNDLNLACKSTYCLHLLSALDLIPHVMKGYDASTLVTEFVLLTNLKRTVQNIIDPSLLALIIQRYHLSTYCIPDK
jgi:hypothetical protein